MTKCTECRRPVLCGQGTRHLSCSPICGKCHTAITSKDDTNDDGDMHEHCVAASKGDDHS